MSEMSHLLDRAATLRINERVEETQRSRMPGRSRRRSKRHALAKGLHRLANRIDI
jgi:hypothetical protein